MELEALIAHIYMVGGRAVGSVPPGALAVPAPKKAPRPRHEETLFLLIVPAGGTKAPASTYQLLSEKAAEIYFKTTGSITSGLREMLLQLNQNVMEQAPLQVGVMSAVMHDQELYLARCGQMIAAYQSGLQFSVFPSDRSLSFVQPLGVEAEPRIELNHYEIKPGSLLVMADAGLLNVPDDKLKASLTHDIGETLEPLRQLIETPLGHVTVLQFVTEDTPTPPPPQLRSLPKPVEPEKALTVLPPESAVERVSTIHTLTRPIAWVLRGIAGIFSGIGRRIFPDESAEDRRIPWISNIIFFLALLIPLVVAVVVISLALSQAGSTDFEVCRVDVLQRRDAAFQLTQGLSAAPEIEKVTQAREQWQLVRDEALECEAEKPGDVEMRTTAGEAQNNLDRFDRVVRRSVTALRQFGSGADLRGPVSGNWIQLYTLDRANDEVYQDILSSEDGSLISVGTNPIIFKGQNIKGSVIDDLIDLDWLEQGGLGSGSNVPLLLDESGLLIWYSETLSQADILKLVLPPSWSRPIAMSVWRVNLYILDRDAQQIWKYVPVNGVYGELPDEYFSGSFRPDLTNAVDIDIDESGSVYVLSSDGTIQKFRGGQPESFALFNVPTGALTSGSSLFVDDNPLSLSLYITDVRNDTVYALSFGGTVNQGYRPLNQLEAFNDLSGVLTNADLGIMYVLSGDILYSLNP